MGQRRNLMANVCRSGARALCGWGLAAAIGLALPIARAGADAGLGHAGADAGLGHAAGASSTRRAADPAQQLESWLSQLTGSDAAGRQAAMAEAESADPSFVPAIGARLFALRRSADRAAAAGVLASARRGSVAGPEHPKGN